MGEVAVVRSSLYRRSSIHNDIRAVVYDEFVDGLELFETQWTEPDGAIHHLEIVGILAVNLKFTDHLDGNVSDEKLIVSQGHIGFHEIVLLISIDEIVAAEAAQTDIYDGTEFYVIGAECGVCPSL